METNGNGHGGPKNVTVIESRAVQYLLMKLRNKKTQGKVYSPHSDVKKI